MDYLVVVLLTILVSFAILKIVTKNEQNFLKQIVYRQSDIHNITKNLYKNKNVVKKKETQLTKRMDDEAVKVVLTDDKAYWVADNTFYDADLVDDRPDMSTAKPIDTSSLSKEDIDKMLFILDNLDRGNKDERGSTGNE